MPFTIVRQDITKMTVDAIVNAANTELQMGGGVCGAIFKAAGAQQMQEACNSLAPIKTGEAVITPGFHLPATFVIHAAGPIYQQWTAEENEKLLRAAYSNSLKLAMENNCESIAFPLISSGIYGYPKEQALQVATASILEFLHEHELNVYLTVFDKSAFTISQELIGEVESFISEHYLLTHEVQRSKPKASRENWRFEFNKPLLEEGKIRYEKTTTIAHDLFDDLEEPFPDLLMRLIDAKGMSEVDVYKRANIDRKLFSKIRSRKGYMPSKHTAIALAIALELSLEETDELLERAGYALSKAVLFDVIVQYFISQQKYNIFEINQVLFNYDQSLLGV